MTSARVERAEQLLADLPGLLAAGGLEQPDQVVVTDDPADVDKTATLRGGVLVLLPGPELTFPHPNVTRVTWQLVLVGHPVDLRATWRRLDAVLEALRLGGLPMDGAAPDGYQRPDGPQLPGYTITLTDTFKDR